MYDIYIRVSRLGERTEDQATEVYEAHVREWAARHDLDIDEVEEDTDVSGSVAVKDRKLERLVAKVEAGESEGILTPWLDRFGRDLIEGALAYRRIKLAGGRLVCTNDGIDSERPGDEMVFQLRMVIAEDYLRRTRAVFHEGKVRAAERGIYLSGVSPFGYRRNDEVNPRYDAAGNLLKDGTLAVDEDEATLVRELFSRRGSGASISALQRFMRDAEARVISRTGVRSILSNRVYVGEMEVPTERKGKTRTVKNAVPPILTEAEWEVGQVESKYWPRDGSIATQTKLAGLVYCGTCGNRLRVSGYGPANARKAIYVCTRAECSGHASVSAPRLDGYVETLLMRAAGDRELHVAAVIEGNTRYTDAQGAVEEAKVELESFRDNPKLITLLGMDGFEAGLRARKEALAVARQALSKVRPPEPKKGNGKKAKAKFDEFMREHERETLAKFIDRIVIKAVPVGRGRWDPVEDRTEVYFVGSEQPYRPKYSKLSKADKAKLPAT